MTWKITGAPGTGDDLLYSQAGTPTLDLRFASSKSLNDYVSGQNLIDFTRASGGTYVGSDGLIKTALTDVPRFDHDPVTGESLGLLVEEERTNLLTYSETLSTQNVTTTATAHTLSFYGTGTVTLSGTHSAAVVGTGDYPTRTTLTFTPTAGTLTVTVSGTVQYANLEEGAFPTSYIPTTSATVTRSADVATITGTNFSSWYNASEGTSFIQAVPAPQYVAFQAMATFSENIITDEWRLWRTGTATVQSAGAVGGATTLTSAITYSPTSNGGFTFAGAMKADDAICAANGTLSTADTSGQFPTLSRLTIGSRGNNTFRWNGHISRLTYFDRRLPNATLQAITT